MGLNKRGHKVSYRKVKHPRLELRTGELLVVLPYDHDPTVVLEKHEAWTQKKVEFIDECLKDSSKKRLVERSEEDFRCLVGHYAEEAARDLRVKVNGLFFRKMKTKWASCSPKRNLTVNTLMAHLPDGLVEYITYHEIAHLKEKRHNGSFWRIIVRKFENSAKLEKELFTYWFLIQNRNRLGGTQMAKKVTSPRVASKASKVLQDKRTGRDSKSSAGSALSQREKPRGRKGK